MIKTEIASANCSEELKAVARLAEEIWYECYTPIIGSAQVSYMLENFQSFEAICRQTETDGYNYYLFKTPCANAGYMAVQRQGNDLFLSKFYILKEYRGQKIASQAMAFLEKLCRENGLGKIRLTVNKKNSGSIAVYKAFGFSVARLQTADIGGGFVMDDYIMEKQL